MKNNFRATYRDNGKDNGNYYSILGYIGIRSQVFVTTIIIPITATFANAIIIAVLRLDIATIAIISVIVRVEEIPEHRCPGSGRREVLSRKVALGSI